MDIFQSAYRKYNSTETALLKVWNNILMHLDTVLLIQEHGLEYHIYADDTHLYIAFNPLGENYSGRATLKMEECVTIIKDFLLENRMKLNDGKTELLLVGTHNKLKNINVDDIKNKESNP